MCGIAGAVGLKLDDQTADQMLKTMVRRGPDGNGIYRKEDCTLLHSRLAIIDPEGGQQPMVVEWAGERYIIVYNGELYNTEEIRKILTASGHTFTTHSDTEVVLHAYCHWGEKCLQNLNGIFAFAVWEEKRKRLFLARDRMGVKPLFYMHHKGGILFASEMKTILAYPSVRAELDRDGIYQLLLLGPGRISGSGVFYNMEEMEPGWCGWFTNGTLRRECYWSLRDREHTESFQETVEHVRYLVYDAIRRQMVSDVPIGTFLSGGLDSSLISSVCSRELRKKGETLTTFSVDYRNNDRYFVPGKFQPNSDPAFIHAMEEYLKTEHHWTVLEPEDLTGALEDATIARDLPGMADVDFSLLAFCREIRSHVKVALSGECADEIFGGYPWYRDPEVRALDGFPWAQNTKQRIRFLSEDFRNEKAGEEFVRQQYQACIHGSDILPENSPQERRMKEMVNLNYKWFMQTLLDRKDRMSMYSGLEVRVPFCDYRIAQYLYSVPWEFKDYRSTEKGLLRYAVQDLLPEQVLWRKKSPYPKTYDPHYMELVSDRLRKLLKSGDAPIFQIVSRDALEELLTAEYVWPWYGQLMKTPQTIAYMLQINFWLQHYQVSIR